MLSHFKSLENKLPCLKLVLKKYFETISFIKSNYLTQIFDLIIFFKSRLNNTMNLNVATVICIHNTKQKSVNVKLISWGDG
jgi:hypothetical protein